MSTSINKKIIAALSSVETKYPIEFNQYDGPKEEYFVFHLTGEEPKLFLDDAPNYEEVEIVINFFCPKGFNHIELKQSVKDALIKNGFTYPFTTTVYDKETKRNQVVFSTKMEVVING